MKYEFQTKHGKSRTRLYKIYHGMKQRCLNPNNPEFKNYGGRGITICDEWLADFMSFYEWAKENGYEENLSIERKNVNGNYEPDNCEWIPLSKQCWNRTDTHYITANGITKTIKQWSDISGVPMTVINARIDKFGWSPEDAVSIPVRDMKARIADIEVNGKNMNLSEVAKETGISLSTLSNRIHKCGWSLEKAISTPIRKRKH